MNGIDRSAERFKKKHRKEKRSWRRRTSASTLGFIDGLLLRRIQVKFSSEGHEIIPLETIIHQLVQKEAAGDARASRVLLKYEVLASQDIDAALNIGFVDSDYTRMLAAPQVGDG